MAYMAAERAARVARLLKAKDAAGLSFAAIATALGVTNAYAAQLLLGQAQLKTPAVKLAALFVKHGCPISPEDLAEMMQPPMRCWSDDLLKEPHVYRTLEACHHYGAGLKAVVNELFGDGILSAIDLHVDVRRRVGVFGEDRVVLTLNGKFLPFLEQRTELLDASEGPPQTPPPPPPPPGAPAVGPSGLKSKYVCPVTVTALKGAEKDAFVADLLLCKANAQLTFDQLAGHLGVTNAFAAQLLHNQAQLTPDTARRLQTTITPDHGLTPEHVRLMMLPPLRSWDPELPKEPFVFRLLEACKHYGLGIKLLINEMFGDGIMSAIDFLVSVKRATGAKGEPRVVVEFDGKFLPHVEQLTASAAAVHDE